MNEKIRFLFISTTTQLKNPINDPSVRYRCYNLAEALQDKGHIVSVMPWLESESALYNFDVYIFHRPNINQIEFIRNLKKLRKIIIADYDDMIFGNDDHAATAPLAINQPNKKNDVIKYFEKNSYVAEEFDLITCSTEPLVEHALKFSNSKAIQISNTIPSSVLNFTKKIETNNKLFDFGYFAGTSSHQKDFETIKKPLTKFLFENPECKFLLIGDIKLDKRLALLPNIHRQALSSFLRLFDRISICRYSISPLVDNMFNKCKSNIKLLESSLVGTQLISTKIPDMEKESNFNVYFAQNEESWYELFYKIVKPNKNYNELSYINRRLTEEKFNSCLAAESLLSFIGSE